MTEENHKRELIERYLAGKATDEELMSFFGLINTSQLDQLIESYMDADIASLTEERPIKRRSWPRIAAAASILIILSAGAYFVLKNKTTQPQQTAQVQKTDLLPGSQSAILQLSNGQQIALNTAKTGTIAQQNTTNIIKTADNQIVYQNGAAGQSNNDPNNNNTTELVYNTVTTKRGYFYPLTLSDGTVAILDAGSSIKYPVNFSGHERKVEITGQVYFEVKHNAQMPFRVMVKGQTIEDLGTQFNINAYDDEPNIKATLIEGSIKVNDRKTLTPGQQAVIDGNAIEIKKANTEQVIAWKNGFFNFEGLKLAEVMRQLSRWYDVNIEYRDGQPKTVFHGEMHRNVNASQVLEVLKFFNVNFQIVQGSNGKKILVKP